jgi:hypothetical protein
VALKSNVTQYTVRGNTFYNMSTVGIGGSHHTTTDEFGEFTGGETCFNNIKDCDTHGFDLANDNGVQIGPVYVYRNTFQCRVSIQNLDSLDGPYTFTRNVFVNADGAGSPWNYIDDVENITDSSRMTCVSSGTPTGTQNLAGAAAANILDADGALIGAYRTSYLHSWGYEVP